MTIQNYLFPAALCLVLCSQGVVSAQDKMPVKFGKVTPQDFAVTGTSLDSSADAIVMADFGTSSFEGDPKGRLELEFHHMKRIRILKRTGFDAATVAIPLYPSGTDAEKLIGLKASTYRLEDGKVVETKLDSKSIFTDKLDKHWIEEKFTFPALKEGAILEYSYIQTSPYITNLQPWEFQGLYPCLWSEYQVDLPNFYKYVTLTQGFLPFKVNTSDSRQVTFNITDPGGAGRDDHFDLRDEVVTHRWVMSNVPAMKEEPFTTTIDNYVSKIEFQLSGVQYPNAVYQDRMGTWFSLCEKMLKAEDFGGDLTSNNSWMDDDLKTITRGAANNLQKAQKIYAYVRDNFTCTSHSGPYLSNPLKTVYKNRNGNEADLNLLLTAMMIHAKIPADPLILSTRSHGFTHPVYPQLSRFNYVISSVSIDSTRYCLDASEPWLGFGRLPARCYNGTGRVINSVAPILVELSPDSIKEGKATLAIITNTEKDGLGARVQSMPGYEESSNIRQRVKEHGHQEYLKSLQSGFTAEATVANLELDSLGQPEQPLGVAYDLRLAPDSTADLFYFNPMLDQAYRENPFKAATRIYPVEMAHSVDFNYTLMMEIPTGYVVDELPKSAKVSLNTDEGFFEYLITKDENQIQFRSRIKLNKATYSPEDYATLRDFYSFVVKKQSEQIVFKKKK